MSLNLYFFISQKIHFKLSSRPKPDALPVYCFWRKIFSLHFRFGPACSSPIYPHHYNVAARLIKNNYFIKYNKNYLKIHILKKRIADFDLLL